MKRIGALLAGLVVVLIVLALMTFPANQNADFPGYMEADLVLVGSEQGGRVATLSVEEGDHVKKGRPNLHAGKLGAGGLGRGRQGPRRRGRSKTCRRQGATAEARRDSGTASLPRAGASHAATGQQQP